MYSTKWISFYRAHGKKCQLQSYTTREVTVYSSRVQPLQNTLCNTCTVCAAHIHSHFIHSWIIKVCTNSNHSSLLLAAPIDGECIMCMSIHSSRYYIQKICWKKKHNKERERGGVEVACYWNISASHSNVWEITVTFQKLLKLCSTKLK